MKPEQEAQPSGESSRFLRPGSVAAVAMILRIMVDPDESASTRLWLRISLSAMRMMQSGGFEREDNEARQVGVVTKPT
jgi:hypothetical protein